MELDPRYMMLFEQADDPGTTSGSDGWADVTRLLAPVLHDIGWSADDALAVSRPSGSALAVSATGHVRVFEKGMFKKRIEVEKVAYQEVATIRASERGVRGRDGSFIEGMGTHGAQLFAFGWSVGGGDPAYADAQAKRATAERDRVFRIMQTVV